MLIVLLCNSSKHLENVKLFPFTRCHKAADPMNLPENKSIEQKTTKHNRNEFKKIHKNGPIPDL